MSIMAEMENLQSLREDNRALRAGLLKVSAMKRNHSGSSPLMAVPDILILFHMSGPG